MKNLSNWAIVLIILGTLLVLGLVFRFVLANKLVNAAVKDTEAPATPPVNRADADQQSTLSKMRRVA
jgi:Tfp pilus assembly protein PilO